MRVLIVTGHFSSAARNPWLVDDLAEEFARQGHEVDVLVADGKYPRPRGRTTGTLKEIRVLSVGPARRAKLPLARVWMHLSAGWGLRVRAPRGISGNYDLCLYTSIASAMWGLPGRLRRTGRVTNLVLIYWDFFPLLQYEIGRLKYPIFAPLLKAVERRAIAPADRIAVMTPKNAEYLDRYFPQLPSEIQIIPPWSESGLFFEPSEDKWKSPVLKVIHGGQLVPGRDIGVLLDAARLLEADAESRGQFEFVIAGDGTEREPLERRAAGLHTVRFTGNLDRDDYQALLRECHLGIAISTPNKTAPTFPSKISEYAGTGIPILVAIEDCSDAGHIVVQFGAGYNIPAGDPAGLAGSLRAALKELRDGTLRERGEQARELWKEELSVESAVRHLSAGLGD